jgi:hypothetical protein
MFESGCNMHEQAAAGPRLQHAQTAGNISSCNMLENVATCLAATDLNRWLYIWLQHAQTGGNMSSCNMLELEATCPAATDLNRWLYIWLQHAQTGGNMSGCKMLEQEAANMSGCNMLEQAATCLVATFWNRVQDYVARLCCILLQLAFLWAPRCCSCCNADKTKKF